MCVCVYIKNAHTGNNVYFASLYVYSRYTYEYTFYIIVYTRGIQQTGTYGYRKTLYTNTKHGPFNNYIPFLRVRARAFMCTYLYILQYSHFEISVASPTTISQRYIFLLYSSVLFFLFFFLSSFHTPSIKHFASNL